MTLTLTPLFLVLAFCAGLIFGALAVAVWLIRRERVLAAENAMLQTRIAAHAGETSALEARFTHQFENLANRIFEEKTQTFKAQSNETLAIALAPLRETLAGFQQKVEDSAKEQFSLKNEIRAIMTLNETMRTQTEKLTTALRGDLRAQGGWGEIMLERILEASGLRRDEDYVVQAVGMELRHVDGSNRALRPDVIIKLPEDKHVIVDAKVSLLAYERAMTATDDAARASARADFIKSVREHIKGLAERRYQDAAGLGTPDFVLMFMPIEGAHALALQGDTSLHSFAWEQRIVIVGPSSLFATLRTIASVWRLERQNKNAEEIARQGGALYDKLVGFVEDMEAVGARLTQTQKSYGDAMTKLASGTGNLIKRAQDLRALGIKTSKTLSKSVTDSAESVIEEAKKLSDTDRVA